MLFGPLAYGWLRGSPPDEDTITRLADRALAGLGTSDVLGGGEELR